MRPSGVAGAAGWRLNRRRVGAGMEQYAVAVVPCRERGCHTARRDASCFMSVTRRGRACATGTTSGTSMHVGHHRSRRAAARASRHAIGTGHAGHRATPVPPAAPSSVRVVPVASSSVKAATDAPAGPVPGRELDPFEAGDFTSAWLGGALNEQLGPAFLAWSNKHFPADRYPIFSGRYGAVLRTRSAGFAAGIASDVLAGPFANAVRRVVHGRLPGIAGEPGPWVSPPPANVLASGLVKTVATGMARAWLQTAWNPPAPPPPPGNPPAAQPSPVASAGPAIDAATGPTLLGRDLGAIGKDTAMMAVSMLIGQVYDQVAAPLVQRTVNALMGRGSEPVRPPRPINAGGLVSNLASGVLSSLLISPVSWKGPGGGTPAAVIGASLVNGLIASSFDSWYSRSLGPAIADTVNGLSGQQVAQRPLPTYPGERVVRSVARGAVTGTAYSAASNFTTTFFAGVGASIGGIPGAAIAMAGPVVSGMVAAAVADAVVGDSVGSLGGSIYEWVTGRPKSEHRPVASGQPEGGAAAPADAAKAVVALRRRRRSAEALMAAALATRVA